MLIVVQVLADNLSRREEMITEHLRRYPKVRDPHEILALRG